MNHRKKKAAAPSPQPAPVIALPDSLQLTLEPDARINVTIATEEQPARPLNPRLVRLILFVAAACFVWLALYLKYLQPRTHSAPVALSGSTLVAIVSHPAYIAFGDIAELDLSVTNRGNEPFTGQITLLFQGNIPIQPFPAENTTMKLEPLAAGASATQRIRFSLGQNTRWFLREALRTELRAASATQQFRASIAEPILVAAIPYPRTTHDRLLNSSLSAAVVLLLWEVIRKRFFGWEAKG